MHSLYIQLLASLIKYSQDIKVDDKSTVKEQLKSG